MGQKGNQILPDNKLVTGLVQLVQKKIADETSTYKTCVAVDLPKTSQLVRNALGVPPVASWKYSTQNPIQVDAYRLAGIAEALLPALPIPILGMQIDGRRVSFSRRGGMGSNTHPNQVVLIPPGVETLWKLGPGSIALAGAYLSGKGEQAIRRILKGSEDPVVLNDALTVELLYQMLRIVDDDNAVTTNSGTHLVDCLVSHLEWLADAPSRPRRACNSSNDAVISQILPLIEESIEEDLTIEMLAEKANMSPSLFRRRFTASTGMPVHHYILKKRIQRASELIGGSHLPLATVAAQCGFSSQSHMTRIFRRELGVTPGELRKSLRENRSKIPGSEN